MTNTVKKISVALLVLILLVCATTLVLNNVAYAEDVAATTAETTDGNTTSETQTQDNTKSSKAIAAALAVGVAAAAGALAMGIAISKSNEAIARQPESSSQIRSGLMLGLVFIETAIIYALIVAILIIFVL